MAFLASQTDIRKTQMLKKSLFDHWPGTILALLAVLLVLAQACSQSVPSEIKQAPSAITVTPVAQSAPFNQLTDQERQSLREFGRSFAALEKDWDSFDASYENWFRDRNVPTEPDMEKYLGQLVTQFDAVKGRIVDLPVVTLTKPLADQLFAQMQEEEKALRALRDSWRPGDGQAFQRYEENRLKVEKARLLINRRLADLKAAAQPANRDALDNTYKAYRELEAGWDKFAQDYDRWKATGMDQNPPAKALPNMVNNFKDLVSRSYALPRPPVGQEYLDLLVGALEKEDLALSKLSDSWRPKNDEVFATYEQERAAARKSRNQADTGMEMLRNAGLEANRTTLSAFTGSLEAIDRQWNEFNTAYDVWRNPTASATREAISKELRDFDARFDGVLAQAQGLPQNALLRPLSEMVIAAVEKEQQGQARLRETFRLYDGTAWRTFAQEHQSAERSRRKIRGAFIDLLAKYNLTLGDVQ